MRFILSAALLLVAGTAIAAGGPGDIRVFPAGSVSVPSPAAPAPASALRYMEPVADMLERGLKEKCGTDLLGEMLFAIPALAGSGSEAQRAQQDQWTKKRFQAIAKLKADASKLPRSTDTPKCREIAADFDRTSSEPEFRRLLEEGVLRALQAAQGSGTGAPQAPGKAHGQP